MDVLGILGIVIPKSVCEIRVYVGKNVGIWEKVYSKSPDIRAPNSTYLNNLPVAVSLSQWTCIRAKLITTCADIRL